MKAKISRVTQKGQVVIPVKLRRLLGIQKGTPIAFSEENHRIILQPLTPDYLRRLQGMLKGEPSVLKTLLRERKRDR
jgi:AbrB family looped-hinge helix DNA binding protein